MKTRYVQCPKCKKKVKWVPQTEGGTSMRCKCGTLIPLLGYQFRKDGIRDD